MHKLNTTTRFSVGWVEAAALPTEKCGFTATEDKISPCPLYPESASDSFSRCGIERQEGDESLRALRLLRILCCLQGDFMFEKVKAARERLTGDARVAPS